MVPKNFGNKTIATALFICTLFCVASSYGQTGKQNKTTAGSVAHKSSSPSNPIDDENIQKEPLSIEKAIDYGLEHNRNLRSFQEEVMAANQQVKQARAGFYPRLDAAYTFTQLKDQPFINFTAPAIPNLPMDSVPTNITTVNHWQLDITQPLFTGFNLTAQLNISKMNLKISGYQLDSARLDLIRNIKYAFLQTLLGQKLLQVARDNVDALEVQKQNARAYYNQGLTAKNDVLKAEVALANAVQQERATAKQLDILRSKLNQLLDLKIQTKLELQDKKILMKPLPDLENLYLKAEQRRPELNAMDTSIRKADEGVRAAQSSYYPTISAFGQYYREGDDFVGETNPYTNNQNASIGVQIRMNLFEGGKTEASAKEYKYRKKSLQEQRRDLEKQIKVQVEDAYKQVGVARADIATAETALKQAHENERMTTLQYKEQLVIFLEVLNARVFTLESSVNYYQALYGYQLALADLERSIGGKLAGVR